MNHRELYAEACRKAFENYKIPENFFRGRTYPLYPSKMPKNPNQRWKREDVERLVEYCRQGLRSFEISKLMGRSPKAIQKAFVRFGFPRLHNICPPNGADNPAWNGGRTVHGGYVFVRRPDHPKANCNGYVEEHRLVVEEHLGRYLLPTEVVHHKDGNRSNNDIANLEVFSSNGDHLRATLKGVKHNVSPENRKKLSDIGKRNWLDPVLRKRMIDGIKKTKRSRRMKVPSSSSIHSQSENDVRQ